MGLCSPFLGLLGFHQDSYTSRRRGHPHIGVMATTTGWGAMTEIGPTSHVLREVDVPTISNEICKTRGFNVTESMLCAGGIEGKDACQGDDGGPLFVNKDGNPVVIGVVSWGRGCGRVGLPGIYARISPARSWIDSTVKSFSANDLEVQWAEV